MDDKWLKQQFALHPKKSKAYLAKLLGLGAPAISKILAGNRQIKAREYAIMCEYFGIDDPYGIKSRQQNGYVMNTLPQSQKNLQDRASNNTQTEQEPWIIPEQIIQKHVEASPDQIKIYQIKENLMAPEYNKGEHVLVDSTDMVPSPPGVFIVSDGFGYLIRSCEMVAGSKPAKVKITAHADNFTAQILMLEDFDIIGRVVAKLQWT